MARLLLGQCGLQKSYHGRAMSAARQILPAHVLDLPAGARHGAYVPRPRLDLLAGRSACGFGACRAHHAGQLRHQTRGADAGYSPRPGPPARPGPLPEDKVMSLFTCCLWWFVLGALAGWLLSWLFNRLIGRTEVQEISAPAPRARGCGGGALSRGRPPGHRGHRPQDRRAPPPPRDRLVRDVVPRRHGDAVVHPRQGRPTLQAGQSGDVATAGALLRGGRLGRPEALPGRALRRRPAPRRRAGRGRHRRGSSEGGRPRHEGPGRPGGRRGHRAKDRAQLLRQHGITTFVQLASASPAEVAAILEKGGPDFRIANPGTWPEQAGYCVRNDWAGLKRLQDRLTAGRE